MIATPTIVIRFAASADDAQVRRLAALDDAPVPGGRVLLALVDGEPRAALSLDDGRTVADPFTYTADLVALLRLRATLLRARSGSAGDGGAGRVLGGIGAGTQPRLHVPGL